MLGKTSTGSVGEQLSKGTRLKASVLERLLQQPLLCKQNNPTGFLEHEQTAFSVSALGC